MAIGDEYTFWMVWNPNGRAPTCKHHNEALARAEAQRLARLEPNATFFVLRAVASYKKDDVRVTELDEVPF